MMQNHDNLPPHRRLRVSKTTCYCFSKLGRNRVLAEEKKLRRQANKLCVDLLKTRAGWMVGSRTDGSILLGPAIANWEVEEFLADLLAQAKAEGLA